MPGEYRVECSVLSELLYRRLSRVLLRTKCDCIALSGGIDTSLIASLAKRLGIALRAYTSMYVGGVPRDLPYVNHLEKTLGLKTVYVLIDDEYMRRKIEWIKRCVQAHDDYIELRNDIVFYSALERALRDGCRCVYVGSGGDEVFAGYTFMIREESRRIDELRARYALRGRYPELIIGKCLGVEVVAPYLDDEVVSLALRIPVECLRDSLMRGKEMLRRMLGELGLGIIARRHKTPAESGAGTEILSSELTRPASMKRRCPSSR